MLLLSSSLPSFCSYVCIFAGFKERLKVNVCVQFLGALKALLPNSIWCLQKDNDQRYWITCPSSQLGTNFCDLDSLESQVTCFSLWKAKCDYMVDWLTTTWESYQGAIYKRKGCSTDQWAAEVPDVRQLCPPKGADLEKAGFSSTSLYSKNIGSISEILSIQAESTSLGVSLHRKPWQHLFLHT